MSENDPELSQLAISRSRTHHGNT